MSAKFPRGGGAGLFLARSLNVTRIAFRGKFILYAHTLSKVKFSERKNLIFPLSCLVFKRIFSFIWSIQIPTTNVLIEKLIE